MRKPRVLMANLSAPELRYLARELAQHQLLVSYVCRYANQDRGWERLLRKLPGAGRVYTRSIGRRRLPEGLAPHHVTEAGVAQDLLAAVVARCGLPGGLAAQLAAGLHRSTARSIARQVARMSAQAQIVVAGVGTATPLFRRCEGSATRRVLNYPSAHHRFQRQFFAEEAARQPEFASLTEQARQSPLVDDAQFDAECAQADLILTGSRFARDSFLRQGIADSRVTAIPYGVDTQLFAPGVRLRRDDRFRIVFVGRVSYKKGIGYLLRAFRQIRRPGMELLLVGSIVGDPRCLAPYEQYFRHMPHVPQSQLPAIYREADVFVFPSLLEGLGLVALEAMACGCPVIVSRNGPGDVVRDGVDGFVVPAADTGALASALERMYLDPDLRMSMSRSAREQAMHYSWSRYAGAARAAVLAEPAATMAAP